MKRAVASYLTALAVTVTASVALSPLGENRRTFVLAKQ